jgi:hypothetical protein
MAASGEAPQPADGGAIPAKAHGDDVDARRPGAQGPSRRHHAPTLVGGELDERVVADPGLHLDRDQRTVDANEQVDLAASRSKVPSDRQRPASAQERQGDGLADCA